MRQHTITWFARALWVLILALTVVTFVLAVGDGAAYPSGDDRFMVFIPLLGLVYGSVGALIVSRRTHVIGWLFFVMAAGMVLFAFGFSYTFHSFVIASHPWPATTLIAWLRHWTLVPALTPIPLVFLLFPDGTIPTRRWRPVKWLTVASIAVLALFAMLRPGNLAAGSGASLPNPVGFRLPVPLGAIGTFGIMASSLACAIAIIVRYRRSRGEERQQLRWMAFVPAATIAFIAIAIIVSNLIGNIGDDVVGTAVWSVLPLFIFFGVPVAAGISILRYHLYDFDIVVKKTVVFGVLAAALTGVYLLIAIGIPTLLFGITSTGDRGFNASYLIAALIVAIAFQPVRARARKLADRLVYGQRATPYEVLSEFSERMAETYSTDDVLPRMAQIVATSTGATISRVWLRVGHELRVVASWPEDAGRPASLHYDGAEKLPAFPEGDVAFPVRHQGEVLGALTAAIPANDPLTPSQEKLLVDLASQAGLMLRNVRLIEELRASRQRLVAAQDEERRRLERNLHDGAQQQLVALAVEARVAESLAAREPGTTESMLAEIQAEAQETLETLRDLARGIYPPLLADKGLPAALESQARRSPIPVSIQVDGSGRYAQEIEAAVYFCCLEALNNVTKYADASGVELSLAAGDGTLAFTVRDDGRGFDPAGAPRGSGLQNMTDRLDALGGTIEVRSRPGRGTTVAGTIPATPLEPADLRG